MNENDIFKLLKNDPIINGLLLSNGIIQKPCEGKQSNFKLTQKIERDNFVTETGKYLEKLGFRSKVSTRKRIDKRTGKIYYSINIESQDHIAFTKLYNLWYSNQKKIIPEHLRLSSECIAWWFMGNGSSSWIPNRDKKVMVVFATNHFTIEENKKLVNMLKDIGFQGSINGIAMEKQINLTRSYDVKNLMHVIQPFIIPCFKYKIKIPLAQTRGEARKGKPTWNKKITFLEYTDIAKKNVLEGQRKRREKEKKIAIKRICNECGSGITSKRKTGFPIWRKIKDEPNKFRCWNCYMIFWRKTQKIN